MPSRETITARLLELAQRQFGERAATLSPGDDLYAHLGIDSMQAMSLLTAIEDTFEVEIPDYELQGIRTIASLADVVARRA
jgi:acyl carrier protein